jgi:diguanylate cyclase (GGDEF)-like protein
VGKIGHLSQIWLYSEESTYRKVMEELMSQRPEMRRVLADPAVLEQVKEFEETQLEELGGFAENTAENMERLAILDTLTLCFNGRSFLRELDQTLKQAWRYSRPASLCMVSIDGFDEIQEQHRALTANSVLRICAEAIKRTIRPGDSVSRYSGADFGIIFPSTNTANATIIAEKIRQTLGNQVITLNWDFIKITGSLGIATYPTHAYDRDELISIAMQALYVSKSRGGDRVCTI